MVMFTANVQLVTPLLFLLSIRFRIKLIINCTLLHHNEYKMALPGHCSVRICSENAFAHMAGGRDWLMR